MTILLDAPGKPTASDGPDVTAQLFQADYQKSQFGDARFIRVADTQAAAAAPADAADASQDPADQKIGVKDLVAVDTAKLSPNMQSLQGLAGHFDKAGDKPKALGEVKAEVEKTIAATDAAQAQAMKDAAAESVTLKPKYLAAKADLDAAAGPFQAAAQKVPEADQKHVEAELNLLADDKTSPAVKKAIEAELSAQPGLVPAFDKLLAAETAALPVMQEVKTMQAKVAAAAEDPVVARMVYADMLEQAGDKAGAKQMNAESMALQMGMTIEQFHALQKAQGK